MELLVVIAIIGILVSVALASYSTAQKKSRDSRRISDMKALQNAWEQYYADNASSYPGPLSPLPTVACTLAQMTSSTTYLPSGLPTDPQGGAQYPTMHDGWSRCNSAQYCFCAGMEVSSDVNSVSDCSGGPAPSGYSGLYCVQNLQ